MIKLALDVDGVLCNCFKYWEGIAEKEGVTGRFDQDYNGIFKVKCADGENFGTKLFNEYQQEWLINSDIFPEVPKFIRELNRRDLTWYIVTARTGNDAQTLQWLDKHNISGYEDVIFTKDKTTAPCNTLVDDHYKHIKSYSDIGRRTYLMSRPYNLQHSVYRRVSNLMEVYEDLLKYI